MSALHKTQSRKRRRRRNGLNVRPWILRQFLFENNRLKCLVFIKSIKWNPQNNDYNIALTVSDTAHFIKCHLTQSAINENGRNSFRVGAILNITNYQFRTNDRFDELSLIIEECHIEFGSSYIPIPENVCLDINKNEKIKQMIDAKRKRAKIVKEGNILFVDGPNNFFHFSIHQMTVIYFDILCKLAMFHQSKSYLNKYEKLQILRDYEMMSNADKYDKEMMNVLKKRYLIELDFMHYQFDGNDLEYAKQRIKDSESWNLNIDKCKTNITLVDNEQRPSLPPFLQTLYQNENNRFVVPRFIKPKYFLNGHQIKDTKNKRQTTINDDFSSNILLQHPKLVMHGLVKKKKGFDDDILMDEPRLIINENFCRFKIV